jgi:DNA-binding XRE family transcriptional regulator
MSRAYITRLERGEVKPSIEVALSIAAYFKKPLEEIFQLSDEQKKLSAHGPATSAERSTTAGKEKDQCKSK